MQSLAVLLCLLLQAGTAAAQTPASKPKTADNAWPKLPNGQIPDLGMAIESLKKAPTQESVDAAIEKIKAFGKEAVPFLYESLSRQKVDTDDSISEDARRLMKALDAMITNDDGARVLQDCSHRNILCRRYALRKAGELEVAGAIPIAKKALTDADPDTRFEAALTCASLGTLDGFEVIKKVARDEWPRLGKRVRSAIERHRTEEATKKSMEGLASKDWQDICASLRLLSGWGTRTCVPEVARHLDTTDNRIKENAINALRGIIDKEAPIEKLSAFDLAEQAIAWKKRI
jgi:HEAT repeat protein